MSVVIAIKEQDCIYFAADTQVSSGNYISNPTLSNGFKVQLINQFIVAGAGLVRLFRFFTLSRELFIVERGSIINKQWIIEQIINPFFLLLDKHQLLEEKKNGTKYMDLSLMIAYKDKLFLVDGFGEVFELVDYGVIGKGQDYILPYLTNNTCKLNTKDKLLQALRFTSNFEESVSNPYILIDTHNLVFEKVMD